MKNNERIFGLVVLVLLVFAYTAEKSFAATPHIATGEYHSLSLKSDGTLWSWGRNSEGQLGDGTVTQRNSPLQIGAGNNWTSVSAGAYHTMALKSDGSLWAWGSNSANQLGDGTSDNKYSPIQISFVEKPDLIIQSIVTSPVPSTPGESVFVVITVKNQGAADAGAFSIDFYKHRTVAPTAIDAGDFMCAKANLIVGASDTCSGSISYASVGRYTMWAQVDRFNQAAESREGNNIAGLDSVIVGIPITITTTPLGLQFTSGPEFIHRL